MEAFLLLLLLTMTLVLVLHSETQLWENRKDVLTASLKAIIPSQYSERLYNVQRFWICVVPLSLLFTKMPTTNKLFFYSFFSEKAFLRTKAQALQLSLALNWNVIKRQRNLLKILKTHAGHKKWHFGGMKADCFWILHVGDNNCHFH